ncbi:MAG TPA: AAA family ATPase [Ignavibacteriales bacterium]|nr:AAA family ATPase [Ignavibacteriales bacterium]HOL80880.1 AAA family ATPase [Ignavibacteriales bacterium]HOM65904.1 AAA family ATPase [Ignavibacteriales bacterium]HPD67660.1 AAA family ATPase [Ignavibacteriales bacterium]HPP33315.1 AAA family ATPase [Ignavibacteriales bacterium]
MVFGIPGTGKSLTAKAVAALWRRPILRMDMARIFGRYVRDSENNIREVLRLADAVAPCVLWIDEIVKAFVGASVGHETTVRVFGSLLTWMQEKNRLFFL